MIIYCGMENNYRLYCRTLEESTPIAGLQDYYNLYFDANIKREILSLNPLKNSSQDFFQILGIRDGIFVGTGIHYPILLSVNSKYYKSVTGHSLYVHPSYRGKGLGSIITDRRLDFSESNSILICILLSSILIISPAFETTFISNTAFKFFSIFLRAASNAACFSSLAIATS